MSHRRTAVLKEVFSVLSSSFRSSKTITSFIFKLKLQILINFSVISICSHACTHIYHLVPCRLAWVLMLIHASRSPTFMFCSFLARQKAFTKLLSSSPSFLCFINSSNCYTIFLMYVYIVFPACSESPRHHNTRTVKTKHIHLHEKCC